MTILTDLIALAGFLALLVGVWAGYGWFNSLIIGGVLCIIAAAMSVWQQRNKGDRLP